MKKQIVLNIAGEQIPVLFDGQMVTTPEFPTIPMEFTARCGYRISQESLVMVCQNKTKTK
jgi:hypothetical protein